MAFGLNPIRSRVLLLIIAFSFPLQSLFSQPEITHVSSDQPALTHVEPHLWVNPEDPDHIVVAVATVSGAYKSPSTSYDCHILSSKDGGKTWKRAILEGTFLDPLLAASPAGKLYFSTFGKSNDNPILIYESADRGLTWNKIKEITPGPVEGSNFITKSGLYDRAGILTNQPGDVIYITAAQGFDTIYGQEIFGPVFQSLHLDDLRLSDPVRILYSNVWSNVSYPVLFSNGRVGFAYSDFGVDEAGTGTRIVHTKRTWWTYSADGGQTFSIPFLAAESLEPSTLALPAVSKGDQWKDRVYLVFTDKEGVYFTYSDSFGEQWSERKAVITAADKKFANAVIAVNRKGEVGVAWYDNRELQEDHCWDIWFSRSKDGASTFSAPVKLNSAPHCTEKNGKQVEAGRRWRWGGDYFGLTSDGTGAFHLAWCDAHSGVYQLYYAKIER